MSIKLARKSLIKFLQDNLTGIKITDNSNLSDISNISNLYSAQTLSPSNTSDTITSGTVSTITGVEMTGLGTLFTTELNIGDTVKINGILGIVETIYSDTVLDFTETLSWSVSGGETIYIPSAKEFVLLYDNAGSTDRYNTAEDLTGYSIFANGESIDISNWDDTNSQITIPNVFSDEVLGYNEDTEVGTDIEIGMDYLLYIKSPHSSNDNGSDYYSFGQMPRWNMYLKVKDDSDKDKIDDKLQEIKNLIFGSKGNFYIYNEAQDTVVGNSQLIHGSYYEQEIVDNNNDLQSILISFIGRYWMNYIK